SADSLANPYAKRSIERLDRSPNQTIRRTEINMVVLDRSSVQWTSLPQWFGDLSARRRRQTMNLELRRDPHALTSLFGRI
ncbi:MAG: hypothetical protein KDJ39_18615, partial [Gammaproteobacteria bacterium]|nr:hypothetical protein [Gammaproteobacteria bacterium]